jgi:predicted acyltransferase
MTAPLPLEKSQRLVSLDAYRGFVMLAMASAGLGLLNLSRDAEVVGQFNGTPWETAWHGLWSTLGYQLEHVPWVGCSAWDLIQPSFMFMVGVAMPFSYARRRADGHTTAQNVAHVLIRALVLVALGIFLRSKSSPQTNFTFEDVLTQIGLAYPFVYLTLGWGWRVQLAAAGLILLGDWVLFVQHPLPASDFDSTSVGVPHDWPWLTGLGAQWNKNTNFAAWFDQWFLNLFPRPEAFVFNRGGYHTLNFIPSAATMIFGVMAGEMLRGPLSLGQKGRRLALYGLLCLAIGMAVDGNIWPWVDWHWTLCPVVKRIWTPSWAVFSTGWTLLILSAFYWLIDIRGYKAWAFPLVVVGMNSIAMYVMAGLMKGWISSMLKIHICPQVFTQAGHYAPLVEASAQLFVMWLICLWMYRQRIFVRI